MSQAVRLTVLPQRHLQRRKPNGRAIQAHRLFAQNARQGGPNRKNKEHPTCREIDPCARAGWLLPIRNQDRYLMMPPQLQPRQAACVSRLIGHDHARPDTHLAPQLDQSAVVKASQIDRSDPFTQDDDVEKRAASSHHLSDGLLRRSNPHSHRQTARETRESSGSNRDETIARSIVGQC